MKIINYPHPTLRHVSKPIRRVDSQLRSWIGTMFELMYEAKGVGLAGNQVDLPLRLFVCNLGASPDEGEEHVFLNPVISRQKGTCEREEGCLSLPGIYGQVKRPESVHFQAFSLDGKEIQMELDGLLSRVVQHEVDHLDGVLFIDRLSPTVAIDTEPFLKGFEYEYQSKRNSGEIPDEADIASRLSQLEKDYCKVG